MKKIILSACMLAFLAGCNNQKESQETSSVVNKDNTQKETSGPLMNEKNSTAKDLIANSNIYENKEYFFGFSYPSNWTIENDSYLMPDMGQKVSLIFKSKDQNLNCGVTVWDTSVYSLDDLKSAPPGGLDPDQINEKETTINGINAVEISYVLIGDAGSQPQPSKFKKISILKNNLVYVIECQDDYYNEIISNFNIE